jgi:hypothetical protein
LAENAVVLGLTWNNNSLGEGKYGALPNDMIHAAIRRGKIATLQL